MSFNETLKKLMLKHGNMSVSDLSKATGLPQPTLHQLYTGATSNPRKKTIEILADFFTVTVLQMRGMEFLPDNLSKKIKKQLNLHTTPVLHWDDLYNWPDQINFETKDDIILENNSSPLTFAIEMIGSSMEPLFPDRCLLIFDAQKKAKDRDCVLVYCNNQFSFKRILIDGNTAFIKSINPDFHDIATIKLSENDRILATLLEARIKF